MSAPVELAKYEALVHKLAWKAVHRLPVRSLLTEEDLAQEGWLTLVKALRSFTTARGAFTTYAYVCLARRYAEIVRQEYRRVAHDYAQLDLDRDRDDNNNDWTASPPAQTLVDTRLDLARGCWTGPTLKPSHAVEIRERLAALV